MPFLQKYGSRPTRFSDEMLTLNKLLKLRVFVISEPCAGKNDYKKQNCFPVPSIERNPLGSVLLSPCFFLPLLGFPAVFSLAPAVLPLHTPFLVLFAFMGHECAKPKPSRIPSASAPESEDEDDESESSSSLES